MRVKRAVSQNLGHAESRLVVLLDKVIIESCLIFSSGVAEISTRQHDPSLSTEHDIDTSGRLILWVLALYSDANQCRNISVRLS